MKKHNLLLVFIILFSLVLGLNGGFAVDHPDSEYLRNKANKTLLLYSLYDLVTKVEFITMKKELNEMMRENPAWTMDKLARSFKVTRQKHGLPLYLINSLFSIIGLLGCFLTAFQLSRDRSLALVATLFMGTSFFWVTETHYPTVDMPITALAIMTFYFIVKYFEEGIGLKQRFIIGLMAGLTIAAKFTGVWILIPAYLAFFFKREKLLDAIFDSIQVSLFATLTCFTFILPKLQIFIDRILYVADTLFFSGHIGEESKTGHTFLYHVVTSFNHKYGLVLMLLGFLGTWLFFKRIRDDKRFLLFGSFIFIYYIFTGLTKIEATRYIMPVLPFVAILSAYGLFAIFKFVFEKWKLNAGARTSILVLTPILLVSPNIALGLKHDEIMNQRDYSLYLKYGLYGRLKLKEKYYHKIDKPLRRSLPAGIFNNKKFRATNLDCRSEKKIDVISTFFKEPNNLLTFTSNKQDRYIFDWRFKCDKPRKTYRNFEALHLITLSPFTKPKHEVPYSPQSRYSPNMPDIPYRINTGPYLEALIYDDHLADAFMHQCLRLGLPCKRTVGAYSYYMNNIQGMSGDYVDKLKENYDKNMAKQKTESAQSQDAALVPSPGASLDQAAGV